MSVHALDVEHLGLRGAITPYWIDDPEPTLVDPGPSTTLDALAAALERQGVRLGDVRHVVLTHVHLDHAGAAGHIAARAPEAVVWVHEAGAPHMADPERLVASTRRVFGEAHDRLWGEVLPVGAGRIRPLAGSAEAAGAGPPGLRVVPSPGHIAHHLAYLREADGTLFAGDALGIILAEGAPAHPPTPPPGVDVPAWLDTLERLGALGAERAALAHAGVHGGVAERAAELAEALVRLRDRVAAALAAGTVERDREAFEREVRERLAAYRDPAEVARYFDTFGAATDYDGMRLHLERLARRA